MQVISQMTMSAGAGGLLNSSGGGAGGLKTSTMATQMDVPSRVMINAATVKQSGCSSTLLHMNQNNEDCTTATAGVEHLDRMSTPDDQQFGRRHRKHNSIGSGLEPP